MQDNEHIIGRYDGTLPGPLLLVFSGMHGNELAGVRALEILFDMLKNEPLVNPGFVFHGVLLGIRGNLSAIREGKRFICKDLNRQWTPENIARVRRQEPDQLDAEDRELLELANLVEMAISHIQPPRIVLIDLHTTSAEGGIFAIATDDPESVRIGIAMHAPVITGMLQGISGTLLHYFTNNNTGGIPAVGIGFEGGQHDDPLSVNRCIAAIVNCMQSIGCVKAHDVENHHDELLIAYSKGLPRVVDLVEVHRVYPDDQFTMLPGYHNFQRVKKGQLLAHDRNGPIYAVATGRILMPLYQPQGEEGFFLVRTKDAGN
ncbi:MAG: succinylglutamate desuccinylase/aspartoacylase family protein [Saprospiraceae bacterium]|nr:succinylglutamate desuccinylase/aspartoacylase family protein [Saprospiraceae bacterium]